MADRGSKGFSAASKGKAIASKRGSLNGRPNSSANIPHINVLSDSDSDGFVEELPRVNYKSNGKAASESLKSGGRASSKREAGKGGNAYNAGKGRKGTTASAKSDAEIKLDLDMPPNSTILMNCEVAELLQEIHEHMAILSEDPKIKMPESFDKAFQYAKEGNHFTTAQSVKQVLDPLRKYGVNDGEICMIANIGPETIEEVYALVPSLKVTRSLNEGPIMEALTALADIKAAKSDLLNLSSEKYLI
uniref:RNA polymerase Rpb4/RPC9 core domain-containing protein n=2 Tax=Leersia perrieri TaxID=77586 RepID=A0A0D9VKE8_9ORYZ